MINRNLLSSPAIGLIIGCIVFGLGSVIVAHVPIGAYAMAFWRLTVAGIIFWLLSRFFGQRFPNCRRAGYYAFLAGAFLGWDLGLWHKSIYAVGPGISTLLNSLQIFWLSAIGWFVFGERQSRLQLFGLSLAIIGISLIASPEFGHNTQALWGFVSGIVSGFMLALSMVCVRKTHEATHIPIFPLMLYISLGGTAALLLPALLLNYQNFLPHTPAQIGWIIVYGSIMQCLAWGLIAYSIPKLSLSLTGLLLLSEPVAALMIDYIFLHKSINSLQWTGAILTMFAIYIGSLKSKF